MVMVALSYSINTLTLLGAVLAIGLVVDDAIVVLENIVRRIEHRRAAAAGRDQRRQGNRLRGHRHHDGAGGGVPAHLLPAGQCRPAVRRVRRVRGGSRAVLGAGGADADADDDLASSSPRASIAGAWPAADGRRSSPFAGCTARRCAGRMGGARRGCCRSRVRRLVLSLLVVGWLRSGHDACRRSWRRRKTAAASRSSWWVRKAPPSTTRSASWTWWRPRRGRSGSAAMPRASIQRTGNNSNQSAVNIGR